ncbi:helix-turn-helix domain-containing protein [Hymenobacter sp. HDW8]|uniref:helix-turn-helix domain-containing protein n=1 Tax=Hymenobacter sp. HDW8 TaxID=2714932 RepID=UPI00140745D5|nr:response regulator transcription factor [Hymenobacter sp. HDW8]QIL74797.1 helix-turn-helix transcriptional regulator [Hymenobacter sp. HDW8]
MKQPTKEFRVLSTVTDYTRFYGLPAPAHPLLTIIDLAACRNLPRVMTPVVQQLYTVSLKRNLKGQLFYGHQSYDFSEGVMVFLGPGQVFAVSETLDTSEISGWMLAFHPDLLLKYPLGKKIDSYGFFSYELHEALHLSAREESLLDGLLHGMQSEYEQPIDTFSQDVLVSQLEVLLNYANRFYHRQFVTRRTAEHDLLTRFESLLTMYFAQDGNRPLPTVQHFADELSVSPAYLSDMLRTLTGQTTQQHLHHGLIEKAKRLLLTTSLSINETAFQLGFEYPQYFTRLFKSKTGVTPAAFRFSAQ